MRIHFDEDDLNPRDFEQLYSNGGQWYPGALTEYPGRWIDFYDDNKPVGEHWQQAYWASDWLHVMVMRSWLKKAAEDFQIVSDEGVPNGDRYVILTNYKPSRCAASRVASRPVEEVLRQVRNDSDDEPEALASGWAVFVTFDGHPRQLLNRPHPNRWQAVIDAYHEWFTRKQRGQQSDADRVAFQEVTSALHDSGEWRPDDDQRIWLQWVDLRPATQPTSSPQ